MKKSMILGAFLMALSATAFADTTDPIQAANNHVALEVGVSNLSYSEKDNLNQLGNGSPLDTEHGDQAVFRAEASRQGSLLGVEGIYTSLGLTVTGGPLTYSGNAIDLDSPNRLGANQSYGHSSSMLDLDVKLGKAFRLLPKLQLTPYVEYDFNTWGRNSIETYTHHELGLGLMTQYAVTPKVVVGVDVAVTKTFGAQVATKDGVSENLSSRLAQTVGVTGDYALTKSVHLLASYQFRHFSYGRSDNVVGQFDGMQGSWFEPSSRTTTHQFMVGVSYNF